MLATMAKNPEKADDSFVKQLTFRIFDRDVWDAVQELIAEQKYPTTVTDVMFIALKDHLTREGKLPRPKKRKPD
jgi:hypothetical protein